MGNSGEQRVLVGGPGEAQNRKPENIRSQLLLEKGMNQRRPLSKKLWNKTESIELGKNDEENEPERWSRKRERQRSSSEGNNREIKGEGT